MISKQADALLSEIKQLQSILATIPADRVIDRYGIELRIAELRSKVEALPDRIQEAEKLALTFRGEPIRGSSAISADFAGKAASAFVDAFAAIVAGLRGSLNYAGPIPDKVSSPLMITGTAMGSFGFEMELPPEQGEFFEKGIGSASALEIFKSLLRMSAEGTDDEISDIVEDIHPRAVRKVADFLGSVSQAGAWCGLEFRNDYFKFKSLDQQKVSLERLRRENIVERDETYFGQFQGFLPAGRNFEFVVSDSSDILRGRLGPEIEDTASLNRDWLNKPTKAKFNVIQVGQGRPRYTLLSTNDLG